MKIILFFNSRRQLPLNLQSESFSKRSPMSNCTQETPRWLEVSSFNPLLLPPWNADAIRCANTLFTMFWNVAPTASCTRSPSLSGKKWCPTNQFNENNKVVANALWPVVFPSAVSQLHHFCQCRSRTSLLELQLHQPCAFYAQLFDCFPHIFSKTQAFERELAKVPPTGGSRGRKPKEKVRLRNENYKQNWYKLQKITSGWRVCLCGVQMEAKWAHPF